MKELKGSEDSGCNLTYMCQNMCMNNKFLLDVGSIQGKIWGLSATIGNIFIFDFHER